MSILLRALQNGEAIGRQKQGGAMERLVDTPHGDGNVGVCSNRRNNKRLSMVVVFGKVELKSNK